MKMKKPVHTAMGSLLGDNMRNPPLQQGSGDNRFGHSLLRWELGCLLSQYIYIRQSRANHERLPFRQSNCL